MIKKILVGNIFESEANAIINTVNCVGVMGKGLALQFKNAFPYMYQDYLLRCSQRQVRIGEPYIFEQLYPPAIINFPTKDHWKSSSRLSDIQLGLEYLASHYHAWDISSLAVPPLGCGNGNLEWQQVGPIMANTFIHFDIPVEMYAPYGTPSEHLDLQWLLSMVPNKIILPTPNIPLGWVVITEIVHQIGGLQKPIEIGRVLFQKIAYFASQARIPTGLNYYRSSYGPFTKDLEHARSQLINADLLLETQRGEKFIVKAGPSYEAIRPQYAQQIGNFDRQINAVIKLITQIPTTREAEVAATVHFVAKELGQNATADAIFQNVMDWKQNRKPELTQREVDVAIYKLASLRWIILQK